MRSDGRENSEIRTVKFVNDIAPNATGSTLIQWGNTQVICSACIEEGVPRWMRDQGVEGGWLTAEYSMLPYSTLKRKPRDISRGKLDGRSQEIQRLIGRGLRAGIDLTKLGERTIWMDCDVLQADGGTRTASVTGGFVALGLAISKLIKKGVLKTSPLTRYIAAVSVGIVNGQAMVDLPYEEDVSAEVDLNVIMTDTEEFVEIQGTGEKNTFPSKGLEDMLSLAKPGISELIQMQKSILEPELS